VSVKINTNLSTEDKKGLEKNGIVFPEDGRDPYFQIKEAPIPKGMVRLPHTGRIVRRESLAEACAS